MDPFSNLSLETIRGELSLYDAKGNKTSFGKARSSSTISNTTLQSKWFSMKTNENGSQSDRKSIKLNALDHRRLKSIRQKALPASFTGKYLSKRNCNGLSGLSRIRDSVDYIVESICDLDENEDVPLVNVVITSSSLEMEEHVLNKGPQFRSMILPLNTISFAIQDPKFIRVIAFVEAKRLSSSTFLTECHAILLPDPYRAREVILTLQMIFNNKRIPVANNDKKGVDLTNSYEIDTESSA